MPSSIRPFLLTAAFALTVPAGRLFAADEPPAINPFGRPSSVREDAVPGYVELSDGSVHSGQITLTRDKRLQVYDEKLQHQREIPLTAVRQLECIVKKEWMEKQWKFKEAASDEKMYTGRAYPAREYLYKVTLEDGRTLTGPASGIVYVQPESTSADSTSAEAKRFVLHKRDKGELDAQLPSLVYVRWVKLGKEAFQEGLRKAAGRRSPTE